MSHTVLVVDDDDMIRDTICDALGDEGYAAVGAEHGGQALEQLRAASARPCVILLDLMMPTMNGWQFREAQRSDPTLSSIPVVVVTAGGAAQRSTIDADAFLVKPVKLEVLLSTIGRFCPGGAANGA